MAWLVEISDTNCTAYEQHELITHFSLKNKAFELILACVFANEEKKFTLHLTATQQALYGFVEDILTHYSKQLVIAQPSKSIIILSSKFLMPPKTFNQCLNAIEIYLSHALVQHSACKEEMLLGFYQLRNYFGLANLQSLSLLSLCLRQLFPSNEFEMKSEHSLYKDASQLEEAKLKGNAQFFRQTPCLKQKISALKFNNLI